MKIYLRSNWIGKIGLCLVLFALLGLTTACDASWVGQANGLISVIASAVEGVLGLVMAYGVSLSPTLQQQVQGWAEQIIADLNNVVKPLLDEYKNAADADKATIRGRIETALKTVTDNFANILGAVHVSNPAMQAKLTAILGAIQAAVISILNIIPAIPKLTSVEAVHQFEAEGGVLPPSPGQFKHVYKAVFKAKTGDTLVDGIVEHANPFGRN